MEKVAVLGAGGMGHTIAADLTLAGFEVHLYEEVKFKENLDHILRNGGIEVTGALRQGFVRFCNVTTDIGKVLEDAEIVLVAVIANRHEKIAELCVPHLKDGQTIVIGPDNGGALVFANIFKRKGVKSDVYIAGLAGSFYGCRLISPAKVLTAPSPRTKRIAAFPAKNTDKIINKLHKLRGSLDFIPGTNVLETALSTPGIVIHVAGSLLNTGTIEQSGGRYYLFQQGIAPSVLKCMEAVANERLELSKALGYPIGPPGLLAKLDKIMGVPELEIPRGFLGPTSMQHRYITEDAFAGQTLMVSLGEMLGIPTPVTKALVTLASVINQTDYLREGRTVEKLGISGLSIEQLNSFLYEGS